MSRLAVAFALALCAAVAAPGWSGDRAQAEVDLSGNWNLVLHDFSGSDVPIAAAITQTGTSLTINELTGSINPSTGAFHVKDLRFPAALTGGASPDGNSISGTWTLCYPCAAGPFAGERKPVTATSTATTSFTPTPTQTATPLPIGGIALNPNLAALPLEAPGSSGLSEGLLTWLVGGGTVVAVALAGAAWFARQRRVR